MEKTQTPLLETRHLKKYFRTPKGLLHAVDDVNLTVYPGRTIGVVGESGCGKSTLGRTILRLLEPTAGEVLYKGENIVGFNKAKMAAMRTQMQMIFQDPYSSLNPRMSILQLIAEPIKVCKLQRDPKKIEARVKELMDTVGLAERLIHSYPHELDGGRRQRIGVARALALNPEFIVCDEPVSALDVSIQAQILNLLMDLQEQRKLTYMFITHNLSVVKHISNEIAVMYLGQCVEYAASDQIFENPLHPYTKALLAAIPVASSSMRGKELSIIQGEVTSAINSPPGCRFAPRCPYCKPECTKRDLPFTEVEDGHFVACLKCTGGEP